jgi:3-hydroxyisobutyrate dehydrogenase
VFGSIPAMAIAAGSTTVGFIGLGVMGKSMAEHVQRAGFALRVYARNPTQAAPFVERGARSLPSPAALAAECDVVVTIVGFPSDVEGLYFGSGKLLESARPGAFLVDMTTSSPALAARITDAAKARGVRAVDAPVSGGDVGARAGTLSIMAGGEVGDVEALEPLFRTFGKTIVRQGGPGSGQHAKLANQIAIAGTMLGLSEALGYAKRAGLDLGTLLQSISSGAAGSAAMTHLAPRMLSGDFAPGFYVKHFVKDLTLAADGAANELGFDAPALALALSRYRELAASGHAEDGTQALYRLYLAEKSG